MTKPSCTFALCLFVALLSQGCAEKQGGSSNQTGTTLPPPQSSSTQLTPEQAEIEKALSQLSPADRALAEKQKICPVAEEPLGSMGKPEIVEVNGQKIFICCEGCRNPLLAKPEKFLANLKQDETKKP